MPYAYGMQNAPAVGNGLGGLPRRAVATAAATTGARKYELQQIAQSTYTWGSTATTMTPVIMMRGKLIKFVLEGTIKKWICDYSESGLGTPVVTNTGITTWSAASMLPQSNNRGKMNFCWSKPISESQTLFCYTGVSPFIATFDGVSNVSYVSPTAPSSGTYVNTTVSWSSMTLNPNTAIIGKNGNVLMIGYDVTNAYYALLEYSSTDLSFVRAAWTGISSVPGAAMYHPRIRTTAFGYVVAVHSNLTGTSVFKSLHAATLSNDYTRISNRSVEVYEPNQVDLCNVISSMIGSQSIMSVFYAGAQTNTSVGYRYFAIMDYSSTGVLSGDSGSTPMALNVALPLTAMRTIIPTSTAVNGTGVGIHATTNIDGTGITGFCEYYPDHGNFYLNGMPYQKSCYYDFDIDVPTYSNVGPARVTTLCTRSFTHNDMAASGVAQDANGLVFIDNSHSQSVNILYKKVYT